MHHNSNFSFSSEFFLFLSYSNSRASPLASQYLAQLVHVLRELAGVWILGTSTTIFYFENVCKNIYE